MSVRAWVVQGPTHTSESAASESMPESPNTNKQSRLNQFMVDLLRYAHIEDTLLTINHARREA